MDIQNMFIVCCEIVAILIIARHIRHQWRKGVYFSGKNTKYAHDCEK